MARFDYPRLVQQAMLSVVRAALLEARDYGLDGDHHFYITFDTRAPGVEIPPLLRDVYPESMTIILQHQYWMLEVDDEGFSVTLAFSGSRHRLGVPYSALEKFVDPGARFGLEFEIHSAETSAQEEEPAPAHPAPPAPEAPPAARKPGEVVRLDEFRKR